MKIFKGLLLGTLIQFSSGQNITVSTLTNSGFKTIELILGRGHGQEPLKTDA